LQDVAVIINDYCKILGIIIEVDMCQALQSNAHLDKTKVWEICFPKWYTGFAIKMMENGKSQISFLPAAQNIIIQNIKLNSYKKKFLGLITAGHI